MTSPANVIVLSSSPNPSRSPAQAKQDLSLASHVVPRDETPPPVPSPSELLQPHTHSRFFPTSTTSEQCPADASKTKKRLTKQATTASTGDQSAPSKTGRKTKKVADQPAPVAPGSPSLEFVGEMDTAAKPAKGRPRKTAKSKDQGNMKLAGKVTKTSTEQVKKPTKASKKTSATKQSPSAELKDTTVNTNALGKDEQLHLDEAMRRRMDWTPPRETAYENVTLSDESGAQDKNSGSNTMEGFGKLLSDYSFSGLASNPLNLPHNGNNGSTKRRRIMMENPQIQQLSNGKPDTLSDYTSTDDSASRKSNKATKTKPKRFTTLTARVTAQYAQNDAQEEEEPAIDCLPGTRATKSRRGKAKETAKDSPFTILSPEAAVEFMNDQDLIFGTCSQLEREDSPQTLREMQQAIRASESLSYPEGTRDYVFAHTTKADRASSIRSVSRITGTKNLWNVGSRDIEGSLVQSKESNVIDLTDRPELPTKTNDKVVKPTPKPLDKNWFELDFADIDSPPEKKSSEKSSRSNIQSQPPTIEKSNRKTDVPPVEVAPFHSTESQAPQMPQYAGFTDAELSKQIAIFGFKSVRGRKKMIDLLQQCWESKHGGAVNGSQSAAPAEQLKTLAPVHSNDPRPAFDSSSKENAKHNPPTQGTSSKAAKSAAASRITSQQSPQKGPRSKSITRPSSSFIGVEEIQDSEEEIALSSSPVQKYYTSISSKSRRGQTHEQTLEILTKTPPASPTKRRTASKASMTKTHSADTFSQVGRVNLAAQITKAVRAQPQLSPLSSALGSRTRPTWHEKILMYDPIILEDFTAWLNTEGLGLVGEDREVGTASVREWCESKGVCCCWKKNASW